jgi:hypothetical protein
MDTRSCFVEQRILWHLQARPIAKCRNPILN